MLVSSEFDAGKGLLREETKAPTPRWRTPSLVTAVRRLLARGWEGSTLAQQGRLETFEAAASALTARGLDAGSLVRYGMSEEVIAPLLGAILRRWLAPATERAGDGRLADVDLAAWEAVLPKPSNATFEFHQVSEELIGHVTAYANEVGGPLLSWVAAAPLTDLVVLRAPTGDGLKRALLTPKPVDSLHDDYRWLVEHFSETYLSDWSTSSLHREWKWRNGHEPAPCSSSLMSERDVDDNKLQAEIARRAVVARSHPALPSPRSELALAEREPSRWLMAEAQRYAPTLLQQGRCRDAAALFEFAAKQRPHDSSVHNNLGFCLIPEDPDTALLHLERAAKGRYPAIVINTYNRMCCHFIARRFRAAIGIADEYWTKSLDQAPVGAMLWSLTPTGGWQFMTALDARVELARFARGIAQQCGWVQLDATWQERLRAVSD